MKIKFIKAIFVSFLCLIILAGCSVVPSSTPDATPTPISLMDLLYQTEKKVNYPLWLKDVPSTQRIKIHIYCDLKLFDYESWLAEKNEAKKQGASLTELNEIDIKYESAPVKEILKRYGLEDQIEDGSLTFDTAYVEYPIVDLNILYEMVLDPEITGISVEYRELGNGEWISAWLYEDKYNSID